MSKIEQTVQARLFELQDLKYRDVQCKLMPTVDPETVIGVRTPELRKLAKSFSKEPEAEAFLRTLPHKYYEENNLHGFLIENMKDYGQIIAALDAFLPYVDNWATCKSSFVAGTDFCARKIGSFIMGWIIAASTSPKLLHPPGRTRTGRSRPR